MNKVILDSYGRKWGHPERDVGKGWRPLVLRLIEDLFEMGWDGHLCQVKEKFGGLRFYIGAGSDGINDRIQEAEAESIRTCEGCGQPGKLRGEGWIKCLCDECAKETK